MQPDPEAHDTFIWFQATHSDAYKDTVQKFAGKRMVELNRMVMDPFLTRKGEFEDMDYMHALGVVQGRLQAWNEIYRFAADAEANMEKIREQAMFDQESQRPAEEVGPEYKDQWYARG